MKAPFHQFRLGDVVRVDPDVVEDLPFVPGLQENFTESDTQNRDYLATVSYLSRSYPHGLPEYIVEFYANPRVANMRFAEGELSLVESKEISELTRAIAIAEENVKNLKDIRDRLLARTV